MKEKKFSQKEQSASRMNSAWKWWIRQHRTSKIKFGRMLGHGVVQTVLLPRKVRLDDPWGPIPTWHSLVL